MGNLRKQKLVRTSWRLTKEADAVVRAYANKCGLSMSAAISLIIVENQQLREEIKRLKNE